MFEYDKITMERIDGAFECTGNVVVQESLSQEQEEDLIRYGYLFTEVDEDTIEILVNRLDVAALAKATEVFFKDYS